MSTDQRYRLFGARLHSDHRFGIPLLQDDRARWEPPLAELELSSSSLAPPDLRDIEPTYASPLRAADGEPVSKLYRIDGEDLLSFSSGHVFRIGETRIAYSSARPNDLRAFEIRFLGAVMAYWLERRGILALHASAVEIGGRAIAFAGAHGSGKTSLLAAFLDAGFGQVTDDLLPLAVGAAATTALPGYPCLRMEPALASRFLGTEAVHGLEPVLLPSPKRLVPVGDGFGRFAPNTVPLAAIFLPSRTANPGRPITVTEIARHEALVRLAACSFSPYIIESAGLAADRLGLLARLTETVPVRRLSLSEGLNRLPEVVQGILADLDSRSR